MTESASDFLHSFWFPQLQVRGAVVRLRHSLSAVLERGAYPAMAAVALGEVLAASALFSAGLKRAERLSIQLQDAGALRLLFAEYNAGGSLRGIARIDDTRELQLFPFDDGARMAITIETGVDRRYQGIVALEGDSLAQAFTAYFQRSEQLQTRLLLACDGGLVAGGLLLQSMPVGASAEVDPDGWNRLGHLLATVSPAELLEVEPLDLLSRVFAEETVALTASQPLRFACSCSRDRVAQVLQSLGRDECAAALAERPVVEITCEFCGQSYAFDPVEVESLFHPVIAPAPPQLM